MAVRGEASGLAGRVGKVEEDIRNLRRLPGSVVPPPQVAPVAPTLVVGGGMVESMWATWGMCASCGPGPGAPDTATATLCQAVAGFGPHLPEPDPFVSGQMLLTHTGYTMLTVDARVDSDDPFVAIAADEEYLLEVDIGCTTGPATLWFTLGNTGAVVTRLPRVYGAAPLHILSSNTSPGSLECRVYSVGGIGAASRTATVRFGLGVIGVFADDGDSGSAFALA